MVAAVDAVLLVWGERLFVARGYHDTQVRRALLNGPPKTRAWTRRSHLRPPCSNTSRRLCWPVSPVSRPTLSRPGGPAGPRSLAGAGGAAPVTGAFATRPTSPICVLPTWKAGPAP